MKFILRRHTFGKDGIFGELLDERYNLVCVTLEHAYLQPDGTYEPKLKHGRYNCVYEWSPKFGRKLWEFKGVPDFMGKPVTEVKFHILNFNAESDGCVGLGDQIGHRQNGDRMICNSKVALERFHLLVKGEESIEVEVEKIVPIPSEKLVLA